MRGAFRAKEKIERPDVGLTFVPLSALPGRHGQYKSKWFLARKLKYEGANSEYVILVDILSS